MTAPAFNRNFKPEYGQVDELSPLIRRVVAKNPNPFTFTGTGVYLIGRGEVAVIDPGPTLDEHLDAIEGALGPDEQITRIIVTHTHSDHTAGVAKLVARTGARTYGFGPHGEV
ncbi:MAG: MBL fold metallo-hydrolase, partial [Acidimicrobiia bacterium]|nr:MBL fold metallo-hydrolase [Acidimicrobiia bacterium]